MIAAEQKLASKQRTMAAMFEATAQASNLNNRSGRQQHVHQMQQSLRGSNQNMATDPDLASSQKSQEIIHNAQQVIRKNSDQD